MVEYAKALRAGDEEEEERKQIEEDEIRRAMMTSSSSSSSSRLSSSVAPPSTKPPSKARIPRPSQGEKERPICIRTSGKATNTSALGRGTN